MLRNIKAEMARAGLNNQQLGVKLKVSEKTISNWTTGKTDIPSSKLVEMSRIFGCGIDYLLAVDEKV